MGVIKTITVTGTGGAPVKDSGDSAWAYQAIDGHWQISYNISVGTYQDVSAVFHVDIPLPDLPSGVQSMELSSVSAGNCYFSTQGPGTINKNYSKANVCTTGGETKGADVSIGTASGTVTFPVGTWTTSEILDDVLRVTCNITLQLKNSYQSGTSTVLMFYFNNVTATWSCTYEAPLVGNTISLGKPAKIGGAVSGNIAGTTYTTLGTNTGIIQNDSALFTCSDGVFTCVKPGSYTVSFYGRGAYNSSGTARYMYYRMYKNGTIVKSVTSGSTIGTAGYTTTYTADFAKDDTFYITGAVNSGSLAMSAGYIITAN